MRAHEMKDIMLCCCCCCVLLEQREGRKRYEVILQLFFEVRERLQNPMNIDAAWWPGTAKRTAMASAQRSPGKKSGPYKYCKIKDIEDAKIVNMYGVVKSLKSPSITQRGFHMTTIWIVDETCEEHGCLTCLLISKDEREIPDPVQVGDIIRFHRLRTLRYQGYPQAKISPGFSWLIIRGNKRIHSHDEYTFTPKDRERINEIQEWIKSSPNLHTEEALSYTKISTIKAEDKWFNLTLQVISIHLSTSDSSCAIIVGWDSTVPMFESFCYCMMGDAEDEVDEELLRVSAGRAIKIHCFDDHVAEAMRLVSGQFIQVVNAHAKVINDHTITSAAVSGFIDHELLNEERTWLGIVMHKGTTYGRRINVLSEQDAKESNIKREIDLFVKEHERENEDGSQDAVAGPSGVNDGNSARTENSVRAQSTPKKGTNDAKRNVEEDGTQNRVAGPSGVSGGNSARTKKGTNDAKRNLEEDGLQNGIAGTSGVKEGNSARTENSVRAQSTPKKGTNDAKRNVEDDDPPKRVAGPSGVNDGNSTRTTKGTNDAKRNLEEDGSQNGIAGTSGVKEGNISRTENSVRAQSSPKKPTNDVKGNVEDDGPPKRVAGPSGVNDGNSTRTKKGTKDAKRNLEEDGSQNGIAGTSGVKEGNSARTEIKVRSQSTPKKGTNDAKRNVGEDGPPKRVAGPSRVNDGNSARTEIKVRSQSTSKKGTSVAKGNVGEDGSHNRVAGPSGVNDGNSARTENSVRAQSTPKKGTNDAKRNAEDDGLQNRARMGVGNSARAEISNIHTDTATSIKSSVAGKETRQARGISSERNENIPTKNTGQRKITNASNLRVKDFLVHASLYRPILQRHRELLQGEHNEIKRDKQRKDQKPQHEEGQQQQQAQQQQHNETDMVWDNVEISSIQEITSCVVFPSRFLCRVDTWNMKIKSLDEMILLCCENCNESLLWSCLPDEAMIEDDTILCGECSGEVISQFQFSIRIQDEMSAIDVQVCNKAAEEMFGGIRANDIRQTDEAKVNSLRHLLKDFKSKGRQNLKRDSKGKQKGGERSALECFMRCYREEADTQNSYIAEHLKLIDL